MKADICASLLSLPDIAGNFLKNSSGFPDRPAFILFSPEGRKEITYRELAGSVRRLAGFLSGKLKKGDRVSIYSENRPEWCIAYLAITALGGIAVPVDSEMGGEDLGRIIADSGARIVFCSSKTLHKVTASAGPYMHIMNFDDQSFAEALDSSHEGDFKPAAISYDDLASIIYTSGTTGNPKGVMLSHGNFLSDARAILDAGIITEKDNLLGVLPLHHTYAFMCTLVSFLLGVAITYSASLKGPDISQAVKEGGVTILIGVPQLLDIFYSAVKRNIEGRPFISRVVSKRLLDLCGLLRGSLGLNAGKLLFGSVHERFGKQFRLMASGGASLSPDIMIGLEAIGFTVLEGYGLSETSPVVTFNPPDKRKPGSVGRPLPGVEIRIEHDPEIEGADGEIVIRGPMVMKGYYHMPGETAKVLREGWFYSGDLGHIDPDGYLFITGRRKEVIVLSSGKNIYPEEVEKAYIALPLIKEIGVYERTEGGAVTLHAIVVPDFEYAKKNRIANIYESLRWDIQGVSLRMPSYSRLKGFSLFPDPLPRTRLGKLRRFQLQSLAQISERKARAGREKEAGLDPVLEKVVSAVGSLTGPDVSVNRADNLELDLGIDSLKRIELTVELEKAFGTSLPDSFMADIQTVSEIADRIRDLPESERPARRTMEKGLREILLKEPGKEQVEAIGLRPDPFADLFARIMLKIIRLFYRIYFRAEVKGIENLPDTPFILVANHASYLDSFLVASHLPFRVFQSIFFQGAEVYFRSRPMKWFARVAHVIPIDPDSHLASALSLSAYVLRQKKALCIFPEGGRSFHGRIMPFRKGIGILSSEFDIPIVPAGITGTYESMPRGSAFPRRTRVRLAVGSPISAVELRDIRSGGGDFYQAVANKARERVTELAESEL